MRGVCFLLGVILLLSGCSPYVDRNVPEPIRRGVEPVAGGKYLLYRPSSYDRKLAWPLVVVCHGGFPGSANKEIRAWTKLAEQHGFLVLAPDLMSTKGSSWRNPEVAAERQRSDERHILASIQHVRAGHNISDDRIFLYGWAEGAQIALYAGLRHPEIFRAVAIAKPKIQSAFLSGAAESVDPHQPIYLNYDTVDLLNRKPGIAAAEWIHSHHGDLIEDPAGPVRREDCGRVVDFMERTIKTRPWIQLRAATGAAEAPLERRFSAMCSFEPKRYRWSFGDGSESPIAQPVHLYSSAGTYRVSASITDPKGQDHVRTMKVTVP